MKSKAKGIGASLSRKIGPLPVWAWAGIVFIGIYYYRNKLSAASGTGTGSVAPTPATPQAQQVLQPGESVYDPNTGALLTAPGGGGTDTSGGTTTGSSGGTSGSADTGSVATQQVGGNFKKLFPTAAGQLATVQRQNNTILAQLKKLTKRTPKPKTQHKLTQKVTPKKPGIKSRARSTASTRIRSGGRTTQAKVTKPTVKARTRGTVKPSASTSLQRNRPTASLVGQPTVRQRPVANATPHTSARATTRPAARPSAPKPRTTRTVAAKKPAPRPAKRR